MHAAWGPCCVEYPTKALSSPCFLFFRPLLDASSGVRVSFPSSMIQCPWTKTHLLPIYHVGVHKQIFTIHSVSLGANEEGSFMLARSLMMWSCTRTSDEYESFDNKAVDSHTIQEDEATQGLQLPIRRTTKCAQAVIPPASSDSKTLWGACRSTVRRRWGKFQDWKT